MSDIEYKPTESHKSVYRKIVKLLDAGYSYGKIGKILLPELNASQSKGIVWRYYMNDDIPKDNKIRMMLGLPILFDGIQACSTCGDIHTCDCGERKMIRKPGSLPKRNRASINLDDMASAAQTIINHLGDDIVKLYNLIDMLDEKFTEILRKR